MKSTTRNNFFTITLLIISMLGFSITTYAAGKNVAKVIILKGQVKAKSQNKVIDLKKGMWLDEGAVIQSAARSFCKLLFIDKSQMSLGPKSKMEIKAFPKNKPGIINLLNGQLRSKVTKNYMKMGDKNKSKLFIKTRSAAMGVRGTDFQVNFNQENMVTSLVTFEGAVAMARIDDTVSQVNQQALERMVSSRDAVIVVKGQYSGVDQASPRSTPPTKINPAQLETLKKSTNSVKQLDSSGASTPQKQYRSPVPPGVSAKTFANESKSVEKSVVDVAGKAVVFKVKQEIAQADKQDPKWANSKFEKSTFKGPKPGGFVDLKTALYIAPPKGSTFDSNTNTYVPPLSVGSIDSNGGGYKAPRGYELQANGEFKKVKVKPIEFRSHSYRKNLFGSAGDLADKLKNKIRFNPSITVNDRRPASDPNSPTGPNSPNPLQPLEPPKTTLPELLPPPPPPNIPPPSVPILPEFNAPEFDSSLPNLPGVAPEEIDPDDPSGPLDTSEAPPIETEGFTNAHVHIN